MWLVTELRKHKIETTKKQLTRVLKVVGYVFGIAGQIHYLKETPGNVLYHETYLAEKLANQAVHEHQSADAMAVDNNQGVRKLEIFLDESYCNVNHVNRSTWYQKGASLIRSITRKKKVPMHRPCVSCWAVVAPSAA